MLHFGRVSVLILLHNAYGLPCHAYHRCIVNTNPFHQVYKSSACRVCGNEFKLVIASLLTVNARINDLLHPFVNLGQLAHLFDCLVRGVVVGNPKHRVRVLVFLNDAQSHIRQRHKQYFFVLLGFEANIIAVVLFNDVFQQHIG